MKRMARFAEEIDKAVMMTEPLPRKTKANSD
jgi:hypothetical protein